MQGSPYDITSPTDSVIGADFQGLTAEEQERQREEWKAELKKTEEEILTLKQVLTAKERHAAGDESPPIDLAHTPGVFPSLPLSWLWRRNPQE